MTIRNNALKITNKMLDEKLLRYENEVIAESLSASCLIRVEARFIGIAIASVDYYIKSSHAGKELPVRLFAKCFVNFKSGEVNLTRGVGYTYIENLELALSCL